MNTVIVISVGLLCLLWIKKIRSNLFIPAGIFVLMWTICLGLSTLGLYGMNPPSNTVVCLSCCAMIIMSFTSTIKLREITVGGISFVKKIENNNETVKIVDSLSDNKLLIALNFAAYIFSFPYLRKSLVLMMTSGMYAVRVTTGVGSEYASTSTLILFQTIIGPLFVVTMLLVAIDISRKKYKLFPIIIAVLDVVFYTLLFAGRYMIFQLLVFIVFAMYENNARSVLDFILKHKKIVMFALVLISFMCLISSLRSARGVISSIYVYFCGSFSYLSYLLDNDIGTNIFLLGRTQFGFIYNFIFLAATFLLGIKYNGSNHIVTQLTQYMVSIGDGVNYNSLATVLHDFIADYGVYGSIFGLLIMGLGCNYVERMKIKYQSAYYEALYLYLMYSMVNSVLGYTFRGPGGFMIVLFIYLFCRNKV